MLVLQVITRDKSWQLRVQGRAYCARILFLFFTLESGTQANQTLALKSLLLV